MKISWEWLGRWVDLDGLNPDDVAARLTLAGLEVDAITRIGHGADGVVVGRIDSIEAHPKADRLVVCQVDVGDGTPRQIVCGATNMKASDHVPVALPGSQVPAFDFEIGERKMRGVLSQGMLCSEAELGLPETVDGLYILPEDVTLGQPVFEALGMKDTCIELGLTPNRADCLSHRGVAREVAALYGRELRAIPEADAPPLWSVSEGATAASLCTLRVEDQVGCPRYGFAVIEGLVVGPSPAWLERALASVGLRSVNNLVDVTNYILMDVGQPLHAFDLDKLEGGQLVVRRAREGEAFRGIDHRDYTLSAQELVIADATRPVAIGGVMGGEGTEVTAQTTRVLIECASFDPSTVRKSARRLGIHSDSSHRFERGVDPAGLEVCLARAVAILVQTQHGLEGAAPVVAQGVVVVDGADVPQPREIVLPDRLCERVLGVPVSLEQAQQVLTALELDCAAVPSGLRVIAPTFRFDLERPIDLVEEVARIIGFDAIPARLPEVALGEGHQPREGEGAHAPTLVPRARAARLAAIRQRLSDHGAQEVCNYSFMGASELEALGVPKEHALWRAQAVANPMTEEQALMRTTLLTGLGRNLQTNLAHRQEDLALFEVGRRYLEDGEVATLGVLVTGRALTHWSGARRWDFYDLKGLVEALGAGLELSGARWRAPEAAEPHLHPGVQAQWVSASGELLAVVGQLHPAAATRLDCDAPVFVAEVSLDALLSQPVYLGFHRGLAKFPAVVRDFALVQARTGRYGEIEDALIALLEEDKLLRSMVASYDVFDVYAGDRIDADKRSVALQVVLRSDDRTLTESDVNQASQRIIEGLRAGAGVTLR